MIEGYVIRHATAVEIKREGFVIGRLDEVATDPAAGVPCMVDWGEIPSIVLQGPNCARTGSI